MNLNEYIKRNYKNPNVQVLKALGASDNLISYLTHTPWNTNMVMIDAVNNNNDNSAVVGTAIVGQATVGGESGGGSSDVGEVWFTGTLVEIRQGVYETELTATDKADVANLVEYFNVYGDVYMNDALLPSVDKYVGDNGIECSWGVLSEGVSYGIIIGTDLEKNPIYITAFYEGEAPVALDVSIKVIPS